MCRPEDVQIRLTRFNKVLSVNKDLNQITVQGGIVLRDLIGVARRHGMAMRNLGSVINVRSLTDIGVMVLCMYGLFSVCSAVCVVVLCRVRM